MTTTRHLVAVPTLESALSVPVQREVVTIPETSEPRRGPISILIADDEESILDAIAGAIWDEDDIQVIGLAADAYEAITIAAYRRPDVAILDVRMPRGGGPHAARWIREWSPTTSVIGLSGDTADEGVDEMLAGGATSFLVKDDSMEDIIDAIRRAAHGGATISPAVAGHVASQLGAKLELERERESGSSDEGRA